MDPALALAAYDWQVLTESGLEWDKSASILTSATPANPEYERMRTTFSVRKPFTTGTLLGVELSRLNQQVTITGTAGTAVPPKEQTLDVTGLRLEQSLLGNFLAPQIVVP